jgi:Na+/melibiose symporter-like transporter
MLLGAIISVFSFNGLFYLPNSLIITPILWFTIMTALVYLGYSMLTINYYAYGLSIARSYEKRTLLSAYREGLILAGILISSLLPQILQGYFSEVLSFRIYGIILVIIMILALVFFPFNSLNSNIRNEFSFSKLKLMLKNNSKIKMAFVILFLNTLPVAITSNLFLFFVQDILKSNVPGNFLAVYFLAASMSPLIWTPLVNTIGKKMPWLLVFL